MSCASGKPRISVRSASGSDVKQSERPSSARWSPGSSPGAPQPHHGPEFRPVSCEPANDELGLVACLLSENPVGAQVERARRCVARRPGGLGDPAPGAFGVPPCGRIDPVLHEHPQAGPVERAVLLRLEAVIPEAQAFLQESDRRAGRARTADRGDPTGRRGPWPARRSRRESGRRRPCRRPASRPPCTPAPGWRRSPRTPSRASRTRHGAGARSTPARTAASPRAVRARARASARRRRPGRAGAR